MTMSLCLTCLRLRGMYEGMEHRCRCQPADDEWRETWHGYDTYGLIALCSLCVRATVSSGTRWSWYACATCRRVNQDVGSVVGGFRSGALPLGRHTMMNGAAVRVGADNDSEIAEFVRTLKGLLREWQRLGEWRKAEARRLADSAMFTPGRTVACVVGLIMVTARHCTRYPTGPGRWWLAGAWVPAALAVLYVASPGPYFEMAMSRIGRSSPLLAAALGAACIGLLIDYRSINRETTPPTRALPAR